MPFTFRMYSPTPLRAVFTAPRGPRGFEHENGCGFFGEGLGDFTRRVAADFFVGNEKHRDGARQRAVPRLQRGDRIEHESDARFHVEHAGTVHAALGDVAGHGGESAKRIYGVEVAEKQNRLELFAAGKVDLNAVRIVVGLVDAGVAAHGLEASGEEGAHAIGSRLVVAGGFDFYELADRLDDLFLARFKVAQALGPDGIGLEGLGSGSRGTF